MADLLFCSHYPFTSEARKWVRENGFSLSPHVVDLGRARIVSALKSGAIPSAASALESELSDDIIAYASSRAILSFLKNRVLASRMAVMESKRARHFLGLSSDQSAGYPHKLAQQLGLHFAKSGEGFLIPVWEYLLYTPRSPDYKLVNKELMQGNVKVSSHQRLRILEDAAKKRVESSPLPALKEYPEEVKDAAKEALAYMPREELAPASIPSDDFPPCILKIIDDLRSSVNVPHNGRYALATYLVKAGLPDGQIAKLFQNAPDFSLETTTYQIKYILSKKYSAPSCATMDRCGICIAECRCGSPVHFRKKQHGENARRSMARHDEGA